MEKTIEELIDEFGIEFTENPFIKERPDEVTIYENE